MFAGSVATLPVVIGEAAVPAESVTGLQAMNEAAGGLRLNLKAGAPLRVNGAVEKLTQSYRAAGFEKVRVMLTSQRRARPGGSR